MQIGSVRRALAAFLSLWFLLVMIEPEAVHSCPVHSAASASGHSSHAGHHMAGAGTQKSGKHSTVICSCPGDCAVTGPGALPSKSASVEQNTVVREPARIFATAQHEPERVDFLLPFSIGPPANTAA